MWSKSENSEDRIPALLSYSGNYVIVRRNPHRIAETEDFPAHYEYEEWQMTREQYEVYKTMEASMREQDDALIELAGLVAEVLG